MHIILDTTTHYFRPSRTLERLIIKSDEKLHECYIYNYEGYHFRFFECKRNLDSFLILGQEPTHSFESEVELDNFLRDFKFNTRKS
jgi:hypothetical protein